MVKLKELGSTNNYFVSLYFILTRRGKIAIFKFGESKPCFAQRVKFRNSVIEEGLYPVMGFNLRGLYFNYFGDWQPFTLQRISARKLIESYVNIETGEMLLQYPIPRTVEHLLRGEFIFHKRSSALIKWTCAGNGGPDEEENAGENE